MRPLNQHQTQAGQVAAMQSLFGDCIPQGNSSSPTDDQSSPAPTIPGQEAASSRLPAFVEAIYNAVSASLKAVLPRRCHEPTGPFVLVFDMLLSLFVPRGACRSTIEKLPLHVVGRPVPQQSKCSQNDICIAPVQVSEKCAICLAPYQNGDTVRQLQCAHLFHTEVRLTSCPGIFINPICV